MKSIPPKSVYQSGFGVAGCEDPRITKMDEDKRIYMTYNAFNGWLPRVALTSITIKDFIKNKWNWETPVIISPPEQPHKNWIIFPEKIDDKYAILHSIVPTVEIEYRKSLNGIGKNQPYIKSWVGLRDKIPLKEKKITGEVCVHHLWFDDSDYEKYGTRIKWNPAIKTKKDREGLMQGLLQNRIDVIATDHAPHTIEEKNNSYFKAPSGGPLVQHSLPAMLELASRGRITPEKVVEKMCHAPADLFRIEKRGYLREGYYADLVLVNPQKPLKVEKENILYKCGWSPFEGTSFGTSVVSTFVNGRLAYNDGNVDESTKGRPLSFNRS